MKRIMILAQDRLYAERALEVIAKAHHEKKVQIVAIVSEHSYYEKCLCHVKDHIAWINNDKNNENEILELIGDNKIDVIISLQHKWIISEKIINAVNGYAFNTHFGKLPEYRGHHTYIHAIMNGEDSVTTTLHWLVPEVDRGEIIAESMISIETDDTSWSLYHKAVDSAIHLLEELLNYLIENNKAPRIPVKGEGYFYSIDSITGLKEIRCVNDFDEVDKKSRAFYYPPHEPAYFLLKGRKYFVIPKSVYHESVI